MVAELGVAEAEACFGVTLAHFIHPSGTETIATAGDYTVPAAVAPLLDFVAGLRPPRAGRAGRQPRASPARANSAVSAAPNASADSAH